MKLVASPKLKPPMASSPAELVADMTSVASLPSVYQRLSEVINHPTSTADQVGKVVLMDSGLTARLLMLVNSALFNFPNKIENVSKAVVLVGSEQLRDLALGTSVVSMFDGVPSDLVNMHGFWRHSLACGIAARVIARVRGEQNVERFFVAGLLHDLGALVLYTKLPEESRKIMRIHLERRIPLSTVENRVLGFDHAAVGGALVETWKLADAQHAAVAMHHTPQHEKTHGAMAATVHIADIMADAMGRGSSGERYLPGFVPEAWELLRLDPKQVPALLEEVSVTVSEAEQIFLGDVE